MRPQNNVRSRWRRSSVGELCDEGLIELQTGPFGSQLHAHDYVPHGVPVVPTEALRGRRIDHSVLPQITTEKAETLERHRLKIGDILFARRGAQATGHIGFVRKQEEGFLCGTGAIRLRVIDAQCHKVLPEFLSHALCRHGVSCMVQVSRHWSHDAESERRHHSLLSTSDSAS